MTDQRRQRFHELHAAGTFVMPNPFDVGSAKRLEALGFEAVATTSSGHAATLGRPDQHVTRNELLMHAAAIADAVSIPVSVDAEYCFADDVAGVAETVGLLGASRVAGCSIEDYNPAVEMIDPIERSVERAAAAVVAGNEHGMVITARAEGLLYGHDDLGEIVDRLVAFGEAGAHCLYAPGLTRPEDVARVVDAVSAPVNVLALAGGPPVSVLAELGVRRVSVGGAMTWEAYRAVENMGERLLQGGGLA